MSASENESYTENEVSCDEEIIHKKAIQYSSYLPAPGQLNNTRYFMTDGLEPQTLSGYQQQLPTHSLAPSGSQYFVENNYMNRAFSYYNQQASQSSYYQPPSYQRYPAAFRQNIDFASFAATTTASSVPAPTQQPEFYSAKYLMQHASSRPDKDMTDNIRRVMIPPQQTVPNIQYFPKANEVPRYAERRLFLIDSYGSRYNLNGGGGVPQLNQPQFYTNPAFEYPTKSMELLNQDGKYKGKGKDQFKPAQTQEFMPPVSSQWNMTGAYGNTFNNENIKYFRSKDEDDLQKNPFNNKSFLKDNRRAYLELVNSENKSQTTRRTITIVSIIASLLIVGIIVAACLYAFVGRSNFEIGY